MKWNKYTIETTTAAEDYISSLLADFGIAGVEIEDNVPLTARDKAAMFIDFLPELPPDDGVSFVSFYLEDDDTEKSEFLVRVKAALEELRDIVDIGEGRITSAQTEDVDWLNNWKQYFSSFTIGNILIKPTWEERKEKDGDKILIEIDPGISFGTGKHETTQLCIRALQNYMGGQTEGASPSGPCLPDKGHGKVLDIGCGSGILSIVALKLGAASVTGTDIDEDCITSTLENMRVNGLSEYPSAFCVGNLIDDTALQEKVGRGIFEIVVANILADVIIPLAPVIPTFLKPGGIFITSGIIDFKEQEVKAAIEKAGLEILEVTRMGEWIGMVSRKP